ncbi:MAG: DUF5681 domain-containing protein [Methylibium sp.]
MRKPPDDPCALPYEVGYGKPPTDTQFKKGRSGNPQGRPAGRRPAGQDLASLLDAALNATVIVNEGGKRRRRSKKNVALQQLANKAAGGDHKSLAMVIKQLQALERAAGGRVADADEANDQAAIEALSQRWASRRAGTACDPPPTAKEDPSNEPDPPATPGAP